MSLPNVNYIRNIQTTEKIDDSVCVWSIYQRKKIMQNVPYFLFNFFFWFCCTIIWQLELSIVLAIKPFLIIISLFSIAFSLSPMACIFNCYSNSTILFKFDNCSINKIVAFIILLSIFFFFCIFQKYF